MAGGGPRADAKGNRRPGHDIYLQSNRQVNILSNLGSRTLAMLKTAATIAAIFIAIVGAFTLTMDRGRTGEVIVALSDTPSQGDVHGHEAQKPGAQLGAGPIVAGLQ
jgi:hypothetical protein